MIERIVKKHRLGELCENEQNLQYWLSKDPAERIEAVDFLRRQVYGDTTRLQRTVRVIQRSRR